MRHDLPAVLLGAATLLSACSAQAPAAAGPTATSAPPVVASSASAAPVASIVASASAPVASATSAEDTASPSAPGAVPSINPAMVDPATGQVFGPNLEDACVLLSTDAVKAATGEAGVTPSATHYADACSWDFAAGNGVTLTAERYTDADRAAAKFAAEKPGTAGHSLADAMVAGRQARTDAAGGDAFVLVGNWIVIVSDGGATATRGAASLALAGAASDALAALVGLGS
ncbi:MAG: hypothetical protein ACYDAN_06675 [Candidatus Limnocylindrales bacterium]